jgi:hypothetical protein
LGCSWEILRFLPCVRNDKRHRLAVSKHLVAAFSFFSLLTCVAACTVTEFRFRGNNGSIFGSIGMIVLIIC